MQTKFDFTDNELVNMKRKIDKLDPVAQNTWANKIGVEIGQKRLRNRLAKNAYKIYILLVEYYRS